MLPGKTIHIVNGRTLCEQQYATYREQLGSSQTRDWIKEKIKRFSEVAKNDAEFRELATKYLGLT